MRKNNYSFKETFPNVRFRWGTSQRSKPKSCYLIIQTFFNSETENPIRELKEHYRSIRQTVSRKTQEGYFNPKFIATEKMPESFTRTGTCYAECEINLFIDDYIDRDDLKNELDKLIEEIYVNSFKGKNKFYKTLKDRKQNVEQGN